MASGGEVGDGGVVPLMRLLLLVTTTWSNPNSSGFCFNSGSAWFDATPVLTGF